jgi:hypothetical protein
VERRSTDSCSRPGPWNAAQQARRITGGDDLRASSPFGSCRSSTRAQFRRIQALDELPEECVLALDCEQDIEAQIAALARAVDRQIGSRSSSRVRRTVPESVLSHQA